MSSENYYYFPSSFLIWITFILFSLANLLFLGLPILILNKSWQNSTSLYYS